MTQALLCDHRFHHLLLRFDADLAATTRADGYPRCGGVLHSASYRRKPRGAPRGLQPEYSERASFCCAVDGCRKRSMPPSLRFLGRKAYLAAVVVLISAICCGLTPKRVSQVAQSVSVPRRTLERWRQWSCSRTAVSSSARFVFARRSGLAASP
ncbi:MAG: hypothetical protein IT518_13690 [Burkholderiales bacterium]|nr:hypothetical protein [Burkholderiales bacterium]